MRYFVFFLFLFLPLQAGADQHALLIGIAEYPYIKSANLEGPVHDVRALSRVLRENYGFAAANVTTLIDAQATRSNILAAIDRLNRQSRDGDFIIIYYSGHGTSCYDDLNNWKMSPYTGALIAADFTEGSHGSMMRQLIIGSRDLRPRLLRLEKNRKVLVIADTCYSGFTVRSVRSEPAAKYRTVDLDEMLGDSKPAKFEDNPVKAMPYPYRSVIYLAASSTLEKARDITRGEIRSGRTTVDGQPHGALTNALLRGLSGPADRNNDRKLSINELFQYVRSKVTSRYAQTPQLLMGNRQKQNETILRIRQTADPDLGQPADSSGIVQVACENVDISLVERLKLLAGVAVVQNNENLRIVGRDTGYALYLAGGALLTTLSSDDALVRRVRRQVLIHRLTIAAAGRRSFALSAELVGDSGVQVEGSSIGLKVNSERAGNLLIFSIDTTGRVFVIYPWQQSEFAGLAAGRDMNIPGIGIVEGPDFGTEYLVAVAFAEEPSFWNMLPQLVRQHVDDGFDLESPFVDNLLRELERKKQHSAVEVLQVKTCSREDVVQQ